MSHQPHKIIISGGGTGGHIFPAIAIANALKRIDGSLEILFVGATGKMEMEKIPKAGFPIEGLPIAGLQRSLDWRNLLLPVKLLRSIMIARGIVRKFHPDVAVGVGGYASAPLLFTASRMNIPCLIQEQNSYAGITNKRLAKRARKICVAYEGMEEFFPAEKIVLTGNPVRKEITGLELKKHEGLNYFSFSEDKPTVLVLGGSLGAGTINSSICHHLESIYQEGIQLLWQTGKNYFEQNREIASQYEDRIKCHAFIDRMDLAYAVADVVISRAGALTIAELSLAAKPSILVPSPNVAEDHQTKNAMALVSRNAAVLIRDKEASEKLVPATLSLLRDEALQSELRTNIKAFGKPDADERIAAEILKLIPNTVS